ncbi:unnamed protein product [Brachionus calyciflorus]|uniref:SCP domain-containing protein n=1 Tax=Brachionus calyciflorus TaxID=104777 RepID=A0A814ES15_9BILA|nr:unnamed protein product [Brachionus calyciflorus]
MSDPAYRITDFFNKLGKYKSYEEFSVFMRQYWYVWTIICLIGVIMIVINVIMIVYFHRRRRPFRQSEYFKQNIESSRTKTIMVPEKVKENLLAQEASDDTNSQFAMDALIANNKYRALHNCPPLKYSSNLAKIAQSWADTLGKMQKLQHSPTHWRRFNNSVLGENLCYLFNSRLTGEKMMDIWYAESKAHNFSLDKQVDSQNFTQMIWRNSREVGFGRVKGTNGDWWYGVAIYMPSGNVVGHFAENVPPVSL